jgi:hypothetical protein
MTTTPKGPTRAEFLRDLFQKNPKVNEQEANAAWREAGNEGTISKNTLYNYRSEFKKQSALGRGVDEATPQNFTVRSRSNSRGTRSRKTTGPVEQAVVQGDKKDAVAEPELRSKPEVGRKPAQTEDQGRVLDDVEAGIDDLIFKLKEIGGRTDVLEALRKARRVLARSHDA